MEDNTEEEKEKIEFIKKNIIEKEIDPKMILDFLNSKNSLGKKILMIFLYQILIILLI